MIPVLIVPVLNRWDMALGMLASIDHPVDRLVIVDNGQIGMRVLDRPAEYIRPILNLGFSGGINAAISQTPAASWWMWAGIDVEFGPGDLAAIAERMDTREPRVVTGDRRDDRLLRFAYAALNREAIEAVGLLDESFYPAYYDDDDYHYRCRLGGVEWIEYNGQIKHHRSATIRSDAALAEANARTFPLNAQRYIAKWGGAPGAESYSRPWNRTVPLDYTPPDLAGRARKLWK